jgi:hypothetical protein
MEYNMENIASDDRIVYVRPVSVSILPDHVRDELGNIDEIYALHSSKGERIALVAEREMAFLLARENDWSPVGVH